MAKKLKPEEIRQLAGATAITEATIRRWLRGGKVTPANDKSLLRAVSELGITPENEVPSDEQ